MKAKNIINLTLASALVSSIFIPSASAATINSNVNVSNSVNQVSVNRATPTKKSYQKTAITNSKTNLGYNYSISYTVYVPKTVNVLNLQRYDTKSRKWVHDKKTALAKSPKDYKAYTWNIKHSGTAKQVKYRLHSPSTKTHHEYSSIPFDINFLKGKARINNSSSTIDVSSLSIKTKDKLNVHVSNASNISVNMQYYDAKKKKWITASTKKSGKTSGNQKVSLNYPKMKSSGTKKLRVTLGSSNNVSGVSSSSRNVNYIDPNKYKGIQKQTYNHIKKWCPGVTIGVKNFKGNLAGQAYYPQHSIAVASRLKGESLRYVSIHECAHILQLIAYDEDFKALDKRANQVYGAKGRGNGMEKQADCITQYLAGSKSIKHSYYLNNKKCSSKQMSYAKKIIQGKRF